jgi:hypothetical protein
MEHANQPNRRREQFALMFARHFAILRERTIELKMSLQPKTTQVQRHHQSDVSQAMSLAELEVRWIP